MWKTGIGTDIGNRCGKLMWNPMWKTNMGIDIVM
jgi:hypothetical protein